LSAAALAVLKVHPFPGNVRELRNLIERLVVLSETLVVDAAHVHAALGDIVSYPGAPASPRAERQKGLIAREHLMAALKRSGNNRALAARLLGVSRRTLYNRLASLGITEKPEL
jgi:DNA-binding NtrC family response regulator